MARAALFGIWFAVGAALPVLGLIAVLLYRKPRRARAPLPAVRRIHKSSRPVSTSCGLDMDLPPVRSCPGPAYRWRQPRRAAQRSQVRIIAFAKPIP